MVTKCYIAYTFFLTQLNKKTLVYDFYLLSGIFPGVLYRLEQVPH